jgi:hypothetical protein
MNSNLKWALTLLAALLMAPLWAQDEEQKDVPEDPDNLVPNGSFENYEGRLRRDEEFNLTKNWANANEVISDLFAKGIRSDKYVSVPDNMNGSEMPFDGNNYAGIVSYSYRNKRPRTYLTVELKDKLEEDNLYCIRYRASLAERSSYASNNLGAVLSKEK